jgi:hypothetical protein
MPAHGSKQPVHTHATADQQAKLRFLATASAELASSLDYQTTLRYVAAANEGDQPVVWQRDDVVEATPGIGAPCWQVAHRRLPTRRCRQPLGQNRYLAELGVQLGLSMVTAARRARPSPTCTSAGVNRRPRRPSSSARAQYPLTCGQEHYQLGHAWLWAAGQPTAGGCFIALSGAPSLGGDIACSFLSVSWRTASCIP